MKKILFMAAIGSDTNGADLSLTHQMIYCSQLGFDVIVIASNLTDDYKLLLEKHQIDYYQIDYTWWHDANSSDESRSVLNFQAVSSLIEIIQDEGVDVAITNTANIPQLALAAAVTSRPHIWLIHEFPKGDFAYTAEKYDFISNFSNKILTSGSVLAASLKQEFGLDHVAYFLPYTDKPKIRHDDTIPARLVSVNAITGDGKNHLETIRIFEKLKSDFPKLELLITGAVANEAYYQLLLTYIKDNGIQDVTFSQSSLFSENWSAVNVTDIFINTSKMETFGLTTVEALLAGLRTVVSDTAGTVLCRQGFLSEASLYNLGDLDAAVRLVKSQLLSTVGKPDNQLAEYRLEEITKTLIDAIKDSDINPQVGLQHFNDQITDVSKVIQERLQLYKEQQNLSEERLAVIDSKEDELNFLREVNEERLALIDQQQVMIEKIEKELSLIKSRIGYRILRKLRLRK
ncbi:glycosyltransferase [Lactococcus carnosus]|uniref:glycosyltransferase n=1 Tax=Pseudolactococcus carnosus TaxID=2749961 RepID=UPI001C4F1360|nr:glycosyltransferase [Lactococcus carnosus]MCJ1971468.1 glycosyltransferase [Lactococcus carnosus]